MCTKFEQDRFNYNGEKTCQSQHPMYPNRKRPDDMLSNVSNTFISNISETRPPFTFTRNPEAHFHIDSFSSNGLSYQFGSFHQSCMYSLVIFNSYKSTCRCSGTITEYFQTATPGVSFISHPLRKGKYQLNWTVVQTIHVRFPCVFTL